MDELLRRADAGEASLGEGQDEFTAHLSVARALNEAMTIQTGANLPLFDGSAQDTDENRRIWAEHGGRALRHARAAHALRPGSAEAAAELANAFMFYSSSLGIFRAITTGAGNEYRANARALIEIDERFDDGLGHFLLAGFYFVAPWPLGDGDEARSRFERAAELSPASVRNQYGLGVYFAREGSRERAREHFRRSAERPCTDGNERLVCNWIHEESRRALAALAD